jgi:hypothetical protein
VCRTDIEIQLAKRFFGFFYFARRFSALIGLLRIVFQQGIDKLFGRRLAFFAHGLKQVSENAGFYEGRGPQNGRPAGPLQKCPKIRAKGGGWRRRNA